MNNELFTTCQQLYTALMNLARTTDSICDSASVKSWFNDLFHAPKSPRDSAFGVVPQHF